MGFHDHLMYISWWFNDYYYWFHGYESANLKKTWGCLEKDGNKFDPLVNQKFFYDLFAKNIGASPINKPKSRCWHNLQVTGQPWKSQIFRRIVFEPFQLHLDWHCRRYGVLLQRFQWHAQLPNHSYSILQWINWFKIFKILKPSQLQYFAMDYT